MSLPNPDLSNSDSYDPETHSGSRPGTNHEGFTIISNTPRASNSGFQPAIPGWAIALCISIPLIIVFMGVIVYYLRRQRQYGVRRIPSPIPLQPLQPRQPIPPRQPLPRLMFPHYFPPPAQGSNINFGRRSPESRPETPPLPPMPPRPWDHNSQFNQAFQQHRQRQQEAAARPLSDLVLASDTNTMGPRAGPSVLAPPPLAIRKRNSEHRSGALPPRVAVPGPVPSAPPSSLQFPSALSEMSGFPETELSHDPWAEEARNNRRRG